MHDMLTVFCLTGGVEADEEGLCYESDQKRSCTGRRGGHYTGIIKCCMSISSCLCIYNI